MDATGWLIYSVIWWSSGSMDGALGGGLGGRLVLVGRWVGSARF